MVIMAYFQSILSKRQKHHEWLKTHNIDIYIYI